MKKAQIKFSSLIISLLFIGLAVTTMGMFVTKVVSEYGGTYDPNDIAIYNDLNETQTLMNEMQARVESSTQQSGITDLLGGFLADAINSLRIAKNSYNIFEGMIIGGASDIGLPAVFGVTIVGALLVVIIFLIISAMVKKDL